MALAVPDRILDLPTAPGQIFASCVLLPRLSQLSPSPSSSPLLPRASGAAGASFLQGPAPTAVFAVWSPLGAPNVVVVRPIAAPARRCDVAVSAFRRAVRQPRGSGRRGGESAQPAAAAPSFFARIWGALFRTGKMTVFLLKSALEDIFSERFVLAPGQSAYKNLNDSHSSATESEFEPGCIFCPRNTTDVSRFLSIVKPFTDREEIRFAVRSGGQQTTHACANLDNGITVDLKLLQGIELRDGIVRIKAGERWGNVYDFLAGHGLAVAGPLSTESGIGGVTLGGGLSLFSSREGFVCDNVVNFQVVLANGTIVNANPKTNSDLWEALRGGGNNFGIVTRYDMRTFPQGSLFGGSLWYECCGFPLQIKALMKVLQTSAVPKALRPFMEMSYEVQELRSVGMVSVPEAVASVQQRQSLGPGVEMESWSQKPDVNKRDRRQTRCAYMNTTVKADEDTLLKIFREFFEVVDPVRFTKGLRLSMSFQPYPVSLMRKSKELGGNVLGLHRGDGPLIGILLLAYWDNKEQDGVVLDSMKLLLGRIEDEAVSRDPIGSYGPRNNQRLQEVSRKYDPSGMFQRAVPGGFKLMDHYWMGGDPYFQFPYISYYQ
ncbi:FAD-binding domain-containing protein [Aspergillus piperis CBS 112811]|uniref:FAD-binding domain-containing protein n=1 Tax=Aspergillus piperis CBS 112811 TaxID=1448313 RepID=A0A8G1R0N5_9EURO|nr:FAD-binding domain-containing protein [Aspergillus piperis CBS 112811]RAH57204.1 FAD-binding domain-containing protein [Aspergillus piperis CBS 112811]